MSRKIPEPLRRAASQSAGYRCEYCRLPSAILSTASMLITLLVANMAAKQPLIISPTPAPIAIGAKGLT